MRLHICTDITNRYKVYVRGIIPRYIMLFTVWNYSNYIAHDENRIIPIYTVRFPLHRIFHCSRLFGNKLYELPFSVIRPHVILLYYNIFYAPKVLNYIIIFIVRLSMGPAVI